ETHPRGFDARRNPDEPLGPANPLVQSPDAVTTRYGYDALGRRTQVVETVERNPTLRTRTTTTVYDAQDHVLSVHRRERNDGEPPADDNRLIVTSYGYDALGRQVAVVDAYGLTGSEGYQRTTTLGYDVADRLLLLDKPIAYDGREDETPADAAKG